ncbi:sporulation protein YhbH [Pullulanibacillus sp. KACC 23026]|uniref:sporulation protein YhbH n=1 Tax=Pullulanibacillus sp. KACC 23026 TaxID=3028315 RepID=UPI0023B0543C|nr:sporulation protein YhbH [Pullulanibacillus sp. KACC 23026]WEG12154.1 sporulation protein YhbH [Pullulanibacillus sp. KACC 23026]
MKRYAVSEEHWDLHRKGHQDQQRHLEKVKKAIKDNLPDLVSEESIIMSDGKGITRIPIRSLDEYKIRYNADKQKRVGQGDGTTKEGDVLAKLPGQPSNQPGKGPGKPGEKPGVDYYEADVSMMDIEEALFKELELPNLKPKEEVEIVSEHIEFNDIRKKGLMGNVDKRRTILEAIKRNAMKGKATVAPIQEDDLRFKTWDEEPKEESRAVVIAIMDTSGSMGNWEKFMARSFFFWMVRFLRTQYEKVEIAFIAHHTEAKVVSEDDFFNKGESGGTICSSAYVKALELINEKYTPSRYNIYPVHFTDGDNLTSDNKKCQDLVEQLTTLAGFFAYGEINPYNRRSTLMSAYDRIQAEGFRHFILKQKKDVYHALKHFFSKQEE